MKKRASKSNERSEPLTTERLRYIWEKIFSNTRARRALRRLDEEGFRISHLKPSDATFKNPSWADYIAALPFLPNEPTTRHIHTKNSFRKYWPLVRELRRFAEKLSLPFVEMKIVGKRDLPVSGVRTLREDLLKTASMLEHFLSWDYYERHLNHRNTLIAELRWTQSAKEPENHTIASSLSFSARSRMYRYTLDPNEICFSVASLAKLPVASGAPQFDRSFVA
jgi:hypothetical protein